MKGMLYAVLAKAAEIKPSVFNFACGILEARPASGNLIAGANAARIREGGRKNR